MRLLAQRNDAVGQEIWSRLSGGRPYEIVERDDGYIDVAENTAHYFAEFKHWPKRQQRAIRFVKGKTALDIGCGAGRVALFLQERGFHVTAIDKSPLAVKTCRKRGVKNAKLLAIEDAAKAVRHGSHVRQQLRVVRKLLEGKEASEAAPPNHHR